MAWIESHQALERHPKTLGLRKHVGWNLNETIGFLHRFWWWALDAAPDGVVTEVCEPGVCGDAFGLASDKGDKAIEGMLKVGWLDRLDDGTVVIHNHNRYRDRISEGREQARIRQQARRNRLKGQKKEGVTETSRDCHTDVTQASRQHNRTQHNNITPNNPVTQKKDQNITQGVVGENAAPPPAEAPPPGFSDSSSLGSWVAGLSHPDELPCDRLGPEHIFPVFRDLFLENGVNRATDLSIKALKSGVVPAIWTMLFLDKLHYAYGMEDGEPRIADGKTDPVALTMSGFKKKQAPTEAAGVLFREIFVDVVGNRKTRGKRWAILRGEVIAEELQKRKGKSHANPR